MRRLYNCHFIRILLVKDFINVNMALLEMENIILMLNPFVMFPKHEYDA